MCGQRNATGALLNRTQSDENCQQLVNAVAISVLYYCTTALSNFAVDGPAYFSSCPKPFSYWCITANNRKKLLNTKPKLVQNLITLMDSPSLKRKLKLRLSNLAAFLHFFVSFDHRSYLLFSSPTCVSIHPVNEFSIIESGFLHLLIDLLAYDENEEIQCHAISTLQNLAASSGKNKSAVLDLSGKLCWRMYPTDDINSDLLKMGILEVLISLTAIYLPKSSDGDVDDDASTARQDIDDDEDDGALIRTTDGELMIQPESAGEFPTHAADTSMVSSPRVGEDNDH
ncbi:hypothetical protein BT69DRAFT_1292358 [Atractiella rhizophila]|nr:hypothetical protein BT69DRAFT_1292358 [Atractiella rhizophila]